MKNEFSSILSEFLMLFDQCEFSEELKKIFITKFSKLDEYKQGTKEHIDELSNLRKTFGGMGSFSDTPLYPKKGSKFSKKEIQKMKDKLEGELIKKIDTIMKV